MTVTELCKRAIEENVDVYISGVKNANSVGIKIYDDITDMSSKRIIPGEMLDNLRDPEEFVISYIERMIHELTILRICKKGDGTR
jgi:hypothetical protein